MADDPKPDPKADPAKGDPDPKNDPEKAELGDAGKKALDDERKARRDAEKALRDVQSKLKELEDKDKSEVEKLRDEVADLTKKLGESDGKSLRLEVAAEKGVKARWLTGSTREELEAAADEYLEDHPQASGAKPPPSRKPSADLKGGTDPTEDPVEVDPAKLAESVPRL